MDTTTTFVDANRYQLDFTLCTGANGWGQIDTDQDAPYYGASAHPDR